MAEYGPLTPSNRLEWFLLNSGSGGSGGSGGESDFSLASVTITNPADDDCEFFAPVANAEGGYAQAYNGITPGTVNFQVVLYKGKALVMFASPWGVSASSGAFVDRGDGDCEISGDCSITLSQGAIG